MKGALGNPARGDAFYPRPTEIKQIYRALNNYTSVYLSAPRRVGKTSILKHLEDTQDGEYYFIYVLTESVYSINEFFSVLCDAILRSDAVSRIAKFSQGFGEFIKNTTDRIKSIKGVDIRASATTDYYDVFISLLNKIKTEHGRVIIMIDEFPQTINNILKEFGEMEAIKFVQLNRDIRHHKLCEQKIVFMYTGSISLISMVEKITPLTAINDLLTIKVGRWTREETQDLINQLALNDKILISKEAIHTLLDEVKWYIPFHIQLIYNELVNIYDTHQMELSSEDVFLAIAETVNIKNKAQFEPYFSRLEGLLKPNEYLFALHILKHGAQEGFIDEETVDELSMQHNVATPKLIMDNLIDDGYLEKNACKYTYTSPILQLWCKKHICND